MSNDQDINLHLNADGDDAVTRKLDEVIAAIQKLDKSTEQSTTKEEKARQKVAAGLDRTAELYNENAKAAGGVEKAIAGVETQMKMMLATVGGMAAANKLWREFEQHLEKIRDLQREIYEQGMTPLQVGQSLEFQTGTIGQQSQWAQKALELQKSGGMKDTATAGAMMISGDIAFSKSGGIKNQQNMDLLKSIAPFVGSANLSSDEVSKLFEFANTAGVAQNPEAWQQYLSQLQAGFTASNATSFGSFMVGLQKGATPYIASGGSFTEAVSLFSGARSVTANEALAGTLLEQVTRLSGGAYEKPRQAMEESLGVNWSDLSTDQRGSALLQYAQQLPDSQRSQFLAEAGFAPELINQIGRLVTPGGMETISSTRQKITAASPVALGQQTGAFMQSDLSRQRQIDAAKQASELSLVSQLAPFERVLQQAKNKLRTNLASGTDLPMLDKHEPAAYILDDIIKELEGMDNLTGDEEQRRLNAIETIRQQREALQGGSSLIVSGSFSETGARRTYEAYRAFREEVSPTVIHNNNIVYNHPAAPARARTTPEDLQ